MSAPSSQIYDHVTGHTVNKVPLIRQATINGRQVPAYDAILMPIGRTLFNNQGIRLHIAGDQQITVDDRYGNVACQRYFFLQPLHSQALLKTLAQHKYAPQG